MTVHRFTSANTTTIHVFDDADPIEFYIDDDKFVAYPPKSSQFALFLATQAKNRSGADSMAGVIDFLDGLLDEDDQERLRERLLSRTDPLDFGIIDAIVEMLMDEWMERPTSAAADSSASPRSTPRKSSAKPRSKV